MKSRTGYTLVELLIAVSVLSFVSAALASSAVACFRLCRTATAEAELSLRARELREKLLFHVRTPTATMAYDGLLSAPSTSRVDTVAFMYNGEELPVTTISGLDRRVQAHRLFLTGSGNQTYPMDDQAPHDTIHRRWLRPGGFCLSGDAYEGTEFITVVRDGTRNALSRLQVFLALTATADDGTVLGTRHEAMIVPCLNAVQTQTSQLFSYTNAVSGGSGS